jgi:hypothetical protein
MLTSKSNRIRSSIAFVLSVALIAFAGWLYLNRTFVLDQITVWRYEPSAAISAIDTKVQFTDKGTFTFHATNPEVSKPSDFNTKCPRQESGSPILGCYTSDDRIYVFDITNQQLEGMKEVTAAHEMLHAAWQRMSKGEQSQVGALLSAAYEKNTDLDLKERMAYYQRNEPDALTNELHSILGTEVENLGPELESYYSQYFKDRQIILTLHQKYNDVYKGLYKRADSLYASMQTLSKSIETRSGAYDSSVAQLTTDIDKFNTRANNGDFDSPAQFNAERATLVNRSNQLEAERARINADIAQYGSYYDEYQTLSQQIEGLNNSIDSFKALGETPTV